MKKAIYKYKVEYGITKLILPYGAQPLTVMIQRNHEPQLWVLVDIETQVKCSHEVHVLMTGENKPSKFFDEHTYIGSFQLTNVNDPFVGHVYISPGTVINAKIRPASQEIRIT